MKRLRALEDYSMLGAGFRIAVRDLELRGAGNLLGSEQSGHIAAVGYELYCKLLDQTVHELRAEPQIIPIDTLIDISLVGSVPKSYIPSDRRRLETYRRLSDSLTPDDLAKTIADIVNAYGDAPTTTADLFLLVEIRLRFTLLGIQSVQRKDSDIIFRSDGPNVIYKLLRGAAGSVRTVGERDALGTRREDLSEVFWRLPAELQSTAALSKELLRRLRRIQQSTSTKSS
jgi:transcription-repair coupling factor (superfamily II helicase)